MKTAFLFPLLLVAHLCAGQGYDRNWVFGYECGIDFNGVYPTTFKSSTARGFELAASISDAEGNLLMYLGAPYVQGPDQAKIYLLNGDHEIISGSEKINSNNSNAQGAVIIPKQGFENQFYIFYTGVMPDSICPFQVTNTCMGFYCSIVDMSLNGNKGAVIKKDSLVVSNQMEEGIACVKHANGRDWWLLVHGVYVDTCTSIFYRLLVSESGIQGPFVQNIGTPHCMRSYPYGEPTFSTDGNQLAYVKIPDGIIDLFKFDRCSGLLSNHQVIEHNSSYEPYSSEFSENGRLLYVSFGVNLVNNSNELYQYDLMNIGSPTSKRLIWNTNSNSMGIGQLQRAPDGKIYMAYHDASSWFISINQYNNNLSFINHPDSLGLACDFHPFEFFLGDSSVCSAGLPNIPNYDLGPTGIYAIKAGSSDTLIFCRDQSSSVMLGSPQEDNVVYSWTPSFFLSDTTIAQPIASPSKDTWYYLTITDTSATTSCQSRTDSVLVEVRDCSVGVESPQSTVNSPQIRVFPNPANELLFVASDNPAFHIQQITLHDLSGKEILTTTFTEIPVATIARGLYFVSIQFTNGASAVRKVVIE